MEIWFYIIYCLIVIALTLNIATGFDYYAKLNKRKLIKLGLFRFIFIKYKRETIYVSTGRPSINTFNTRSLGKLSLIYQIFNYLYILSYFVCAIIAINTGNNMFKSYALNSMLIYFIFVLSIALFLVFRYIPIKDSKKQ